MGLKRRRYKYKLLTIGLLVGCVGCSLYLVHSLGNDEPKAPLPSVAQDTTSKEQPTKAEPSFPVRLSIPSIKVDAALDYVGLTPQGDMASPNGPANAGWYTPGPRPGQTGSAVIDGHFGWKDDLPAVFDNLHKVQQGDNLIVKDDRGATTTFIVREIRTFGKDDDASSVFHSNDNKSHLNLITCHGNWSNTQKSFVSRLVVFADEI